MPLSIVTTCVGVIEFVLIASVSNNKKAQKKQEKEKEKKEPEELKEKLDEALEKKKQKLTDSLCLLAALFATIVGVTKICIL